MSHSNQTALALTPRNFDEAKAIAAYLSKSSLLPAALKGKEADVLLTFMTGQELGLSPMQSLRGIHIIEGKPSLSADLMVAVVRRSGACEYFHEVEGDDTHAIYETQRRGGDKPQRASFSLDDAKRAGLLHKDNWKRYPGAMLRARAKSALAGMVYEDLLFGCYTPDELDREIVDLVEAAPGRYEPPSQAAGFSAPPAAATSALAPSPDTADTDVAAHSPGFAAFTELEKAIGEAATQQDLRALIPQIKSQDPDVQELLRPLYSARSKDLG
jgi:hypothetical protein